MQPRRRTTTVLTIAAAVTAMLLASGVGAVEAAPRSVHFTAAGDYSTGSNAQAVLTGIGASGSELNLALGDLSYGTTGQEQAFCDLVTARVGAGFPFELISGNHESNGVNGNINDFSACLPNQLPGLVGTYGRQWYADYPQSAPTVRFVMISPGLTFPDGAWSYAAGSPRYTWTANAIDGARAAGIPWVVVGMHKPCVSVGEYACEADVSGVTDLLLQKKVDLVLTGHEHLYQRSKQVALGSQCSTLVTNGYQPGCVVDADNQLVKGAGTVFASVGTGGVPLRDVHSQDPEASYFAAMSGANSSPSYGFLDVVADADTLTARFVARTGVFADAFSIGPPVDPPANAAPTAVIAPPACAALACTLDGSGSTDTDGTIASYAWTFGDGATGAGPTASHTYAIGGTYPVTLTVTDDGGQTGTASSSVTVASTAAPFAADAFSRTVSSGFGAADVGGTWTVSPSSSGSVSGGVGRLRMAAAGAGPGAYLGTASSADTDLTLTVSVDKSATGTGTYVWVRGRRVPGAGDYRSRLWFQSGGVLRLSLARTDAGGAETALGGSVVLPGGVSPGEQLRLRLQVTGQTPSVVRARLWRLGQPEPTSWTVSAADSTPALQAPGYVGVTTYLSSAATNAPTVVSLDDLEAVVP